tara:strand:- start:4249 stop:4698 length:450 start_codon:yes stop_codon:yes gene_type:complete
MKFKIVFYLFLFVCIILFFQLINTNKILNHQDLLIQSQNNLHSRLKDSLSSLEDLLSVRQYFTLEDNTEISKTIKAELLSYNLNGKLQVLVKDLPMEERFLIDNVQLVNAYWVLIGFRSSKSKGQAFLTYQKTAKGIEFKTMVSVINSL